MFPSHDRWGFGVFSILFYPLLLILDLQILIDALIANKQDEDDKINFLGRLHVSKKILPTPLSVLAVQIVNREKLVSELRSYWVGWRRQPGMFDLHKNAVEEL